MVSYPELHDVYLSLVGDVNFDPWSKCCLISPLSSRLSQFPRLNYCQEGTMSLSFGDLAGVYAVSHSFSDHLCFHREHSWSASPVCLVSQAHSADHSQVCCAPSPAQGQQVPSTTLFPVPSCPPWFGCADPCLPRPCRTPTGTHLYTVQTCCLPFPCCLILPFLTKSVL